jgi:predicted ATPase/transcriptional regulator with XRE-family HTH domain
MTSETSFGAWIARRRRGLGMTQADLASCAGCSLSAIRKIETDERRPSLQIAELLCGCLRIPAAQRALFLNVARGELRVERLPAAHDENAADLAAVVATGQPAPAAPPTNLPAAITPLVGREFERAELARLLADPHCRLLTITGAGGMGKTRLAMATAASLTEVFAGGVYFVSLAPVTAPRFIISTIVETAGLALDASDDPIAQLANHLRDRPALLVIDNAEHLLEGIGVLSQLLQRASCIKLLVTSRERLNLQGEWVFELHGLPVPPPGQLDRLEQYSAVTMFLASARRADHRFTFGAADRAHVARICQLVDGMPLGIELAATWVRTLTCEEIAGEIQHDLDFLTASMRDAPPRHRSLRAVFEHSWHLLPDPERAILSRLSVFRGGFTRDVAQQVAGASLGLLASLVSRSLLQRSEGGRYDLHEMVRQFAAQKLREAGEEADVRHKHAAACLSLVQHVSLLAQSPAAEAWRARLDLEYNNLRAALAWASDGRNGSEAEILGLRLATALGRYWYLQGLWIEGRHWLETLLALPAAQAPTRERGQALTELSILLDCLSDYDRARRHFDEAITLSRDCGDEWTTAWALYNFSHLLLLHFQFQQAEQMATESLGIFRKLNDRWGMAVCLGRLSSILTSRGDHTTAMRLTEESAVLFEATQDFGGLASARIVGGGIVFNLKDYARAGEMFQEGYDLYHGLRNRGGVRWALRCLGAVALAQEQYAQALRWSREALALAWDLRTKTAIADLFLELTKALAGVGDLARAARVFAAAVALAEDIRTPFSQGKQDPLLALLRGGLDEATLGRELAAGKAASLEQAVADALGPGEFAAAPIKP